MTQQRCMHPKMTCNENVTWRPETSKTIPKTSPYSASFDQSPSIPNWSLFRRGLFLPTTFFVFTLSSDFALRPSRRFVRACRYIFLWGVNFFSRVVLWSLRVALHTHEPSVLFHPNKIHSPHRKNRSILTHTDSILKKAIRRAAVDRLKAESRAHTHMHTHTNTNEVLLRVEKV